MKTQRCSACGWPGQTVDAPCFVCGVDVQPYPRSDEEEPDAVRAMRRRAALAELGLHLPLEVT